MEVFHEADVSVTFVPPSSENGRKKRFSLGASTVWGFNYDPITERAERSISKTAGPLQFKCAGNFVAK